MHSERITTQARRIIGISSLAFIASAGSGYFWRRQKEREKQQRYQLSSERKNPTNMAVTTPFQVRPAAVSLSGFTFNLQLSCIVESHPAPERNPFSPFHSSFYRPVSSWHNQTRTSD